MLFGFPAVCSCAFPKVGHLLFLCLDIFPMDMTLCIIFYCDNYSYHVLKIGRVLKH